MKREDIEKAVAIYTAQAEDSDYAEVRDVKQAFVSGAEWMGKNSWISVDDGYPPFEKEFPLSKRKSYFVRAINGSICQEVVYTVAKLIHDSRFSCEMDWVSVTHWMPIPSFDEILEANRDVLERIKEKGS